MGDIRKLNTLYGCEAPTKPQVVQCVDVYTNGWCYTWGRRGGCQRYKVFMKDYCPKTCGMCADLEGGTGAVIIQSKCEDKDVRCPGWASYVNYKCSKFLGDNCPKSCRKCTGASYGETSNHNQQAIVIDGGRPSIVIEGGHGWQLGGGNGCDR